MFGNLINNALNSAGGIKGIAKSVVTFLQKGVQVYDASKNSIVIGGLEITGWENASISEVELTKDVLGISKDEVAFIKQTHVRKLNISLLPTSPTNKNLEKLAYVCMNKNKFFNIVIFENGEWIGDYKAQFATDRGMDMALEAGNVNWVFFIVPNETRSTMVNTIDTSAVTGE